MVVIGAMLVSSTSLASDHRRTVHSEGKTRAGDASVVGVYYRPDVYDPTHLVVHADGTFFWSIYGYDFGVGGDQGCWDIDKGALVLTPMPGRSALVWPGSAGLGEIRRATLRVTPDGGLSLEAIMRNGYEEPALQRSAVVPRSCVWGHRQVRLSARRVRPIRSATDGYREVTGA